MPTVRSAVCHPCDRNSFFFISKTVLRFSSAFDSLRLFSASFDKPIRPSLTSFLSFDNSSSESFRNCFSFSSFIIFVPFFPYYKSSLQYKTILFYYQNVSLSTSSRFADLGKTFSEQEERCRKFPFLCSVTAAFLILPKNSDSIT